MNLFPTQINLTGLINLLVASRTALKSPEVLLVLLMCPLVQENVMNNVLSLAYTITEMNESRQTTLGKQLTQTLLFCVFVRLGGERIP